MAAILDLRFPFIPGRFDSCSVEFLDRENVGIAVGILFLAILNAEIKVLPVSGRHLGFLTSR